MLAVVQTYGVSTCRSPEGMVSRHGRVWRDLMPSTQYARAFAAGNVPCTASFWIVPGTYAEEPTLEERVNTQLRELGAVFGAEGR